MSRSNGNKVECAKCARLWLSKLERMHFRNYYGLRSVGRFRGLGFDGRIASPKQIQYWESIGIGQLYNGVGSTGVDIGFIDAQLGLSIAVEV